MKPRIPAVVELVVNNQSEAPRSVAAPVVTPKAGSHQHGLAQSVVNGGHDGHVRRKSR
ncbi:MAG: hypothetical protein ACRDWV_04755 [Acidimicrobiales bacterium]